MAIAPTRSYRVTIMPSSDVTTVSTPTWLEMCDDATAMVDRATITLDREQPKLTKHKRKPPRQLLVLLLYPQ